MNVSLAMHLYPCSHRIVTSPKPFIACKLRDVNYRHRHRDRKIFDDRNNTSLDYHERLRKLKMFSLERRRDRYRIIYGWQHIEGIKENIMKLRINNNKLNRLINNGSGTKKGIKLSSKMKSKLYNSPLRETE